MPSGPFDYLDLINSGVTFAKRDPMVGFEKVIGASAALRDLIAPSTGLLQSTLPSDLNAESFSSLKALHGPYDALWTVASAQPFSATMSSLASVANVAGSIGNGLGSPSTAAYLTSLPLPSSAAAFGLDARDAFAAARAITLPYLASASAVFSMESSLARLNSSFVPSPISAGVSNFWGVTPTTLGLLQSGVTGVAEAARAAWSTIREDTSSLAMSSVSLWQTPALEMYTAAYAAGVVALPASDLPALDDEMEDVLQEAVDELEARLAALDTDLVEVYRGAIRAIETGGPDWQRHSMTSFRELTTHVLHKLAPDAALLPTASPEDLANGRPTRLARMRFIFSAVAGPEIAGFFSADMKAAIELFTLLNSGTHKLGYKASAEQLHYLRGRIAGLLSSMLAARGL
jgi:hypothetical protein